MDMKHGLVMRPEQRLIITPRLQQALKILQMPTLELQQMLKSEILMNPLLEEVDEVLENTETEEIREEQLTPDDTESKEDDKDPDWAEFYEDRADTPAVRREREDTEHYEKVQTTRVSFYEHMLSQLRLACEDAGDVKIGEFLVGSLDDRGFLSVPLEELSAETTWTVEELERVLALIQRFEPAGVGARDHRECLLIQLRARDEDDTLAYQIVSERYDDMLRNRHHEIAKAIGVSDEEIQGAKDHLAMLNLNPAGELIGDDAKYVFPDLVVERVGDKYEVYLNDRDIPRLRISVAYQNVLKGDEGREGDGAREYIEGKLNSAKWLIQTIEQRRKTMVKVMRCIVEVQQEFFEKGISHLKPLTLSQIAERIGMHESTVSRVTRGKYVQTTRGVFELKYFFSAAISTDDGDISAKVARDIIAQLIQEEDKGKPLSDQKIADILGDRGLKIARRTVAKYREQMEIPTARYRKRF
jgi:RNA polymerase sigma-54 factor